MNKAEINNRCAMETGIVVNCPGAIAFLEYIKLVEVTEKSVKPTALLNSLFGKCREDIIKSIVKLCIGQMIEDGIFDQDTLGFDVDKGNLCIKRSAFPLTYAAIRNFLTIVGVLEKERNGEICISDSYENDLVADLKEHRKKFSLSQLLKQQEEQSRRGWEAEEFVLQLEKHRIPSKAHKIKRISDFDVAAGYDIISYESENSEKYNRFIEVKCYLGKPHFYWSENECDTARQKGEKYILCLVDYNRIGEDGYIPQYIADPYNAIFSDENWLVNTASYRIRQI